MLIHLQNEEIKNEEILLIQNKKSKTYIVILESFSVKLMNSCFHPFLLLFDTNVKYSFQKHVSAVSQINILPVCRDITNTYVALLTLVEMKALTLKLIKIY